MAINKVLGKIQMEIHELAPSLEQFVDDNIQPSAEDCEKLQTQLNNLLENIAVYKYQKQNREISPSFSIHAKLSEQGAKEEKQEVVAEEIKLAVKIVEEEKAKVLEAIPEQIKEVLVPEQIKTEAIHESIKKVESAPKHGLIIGLNDKFRFLNELFSHNSLEYNIALEQLNNLTSWNDTEIYLNSLKSLYGWNEEGDSVKHLYLLAKQRFT